MLEINEQQTKVWQRKTPRGSKLVATASLAFSIVYFLHDTSMDLLLIDKYQLDNGILKKYIILTKTLLAKSCFISELA
jgi:hypothetical protein